MPDDEPVAEPAPTESRPAPEVVHPVAPSADSQAPAVVAVIVASDPGAWFEESLEALGAQTYENLSVLVIDAASRQDLTDRVQAVLPAAFVRRLRYNPGYAAATNRALRIVQGADYLLLCHDDVAPLPDAVDQMVRRAYGNNAAIVTPKYVDWNDPRTLIGLGGTVDVTGAFVPFVEPGELDQQQHDGIEEAFVTKGGAMLVEAEFFAHLGGFDPVMTTYGEGVDFSWRAQVAGGTVAVAPQARVRHLQASHVKQRAPWVDAEDEDSNAPLDGSVLRRRHQLRTALKVHRRGYFLLAVLAQLLSTVGEVLYAFVSGRRHLATAAFAAWTWNASHWRNLLRAKRAVERVRVVDGRTLAANYGSVRGRIGDTLRQEYQHWRADVAAHDFGRDVSRFAKQISRLPVVVFGAVVLVWILGSRELFSGTLPAFGQFMPLDAPMDSIRHYLGIWPSPTGDSEFRSPAHLLLAAVEFVSFGAVGTAARLLVLLAIPFGVWGASRLARPLRSSSARMLAAVAYAAVPLGYDAIGAGRFDALLCYAVMPWLFSRLLRLDGTAPFPGRRGALRLRDRRETAEDDPIVSVRVGIAVTDPATPDPTLPPQSAPIRDRRSGGARGYVQFLVLRRLVPLAIITAIVGSFTAQVIPMVLVLLAAFVVGDFIAGDRRSASDFVRVGTVGVGAMLLAFLLVLPAFLGNASGWSSLWSSPRSQGDLGEFLRFRAGSMATSWLTFALLLVAAVPLIIGRDWRFRLSVKLWTVAITSFLLTWISARGWLGPVLLDAWVWLAPAAVAMVLSAGVAVVALRYDVPHWRPSIRQATRFFAGALIVLAFLPVVGRSFAGAWGLPDSTPSELVTWMDRATNATGDAQTDGSFRTLWLGAAEAMPGGAIDMGAVSGAITTNSSRAGSFAPPTSGGAAQATFADAIDAAREGETIELGRVLGPYGIRYLAVPLQAGSADDDDARPLPVDQGLVDGLAQQLDLRQVASDDSLVVYENDEWVPMIASLSDQSSLVASANDKAQPLGNDRSVNLTGDEHAHWFGRFGPGQLYVAQAGSDAWTLVADGQQVERKDAFGWGSRFDVEDAQSVSLIYQTPTNIRVIQVLNATLWIVAVAAALHYLPRRKQFT